MEVHVSEPISAKMAPLFMGPMGSDGIAGERDRLSTEWAIHYWPLYCSHLLMSVYMASKHLHILHPSGEIYPHVSSPDVFLTNFPIMIFSKSLTIQLIHWLQPMNQRTIAHMATSSPEQTVIPCALPEVLCIVEIFLYWCLQGCPRKGP